MIGGEPERELREIGVRLGRDPGWDLEAWESHVRAAMRARGAALLEAFLAERLRDEEAPVCARNHLPAPMVSCGRRSKTLRTSLGPVRLARRRFACPVCGEVLYPADAKLDAAHTGFSPGLRRMMALAGACEPFGPGAMLLAELAGVQVDAKDVERVSEDTGRLADAWMREEGAKAALLAGLGAPTVPEAPDILYLSIDGIGVPMRRSELEGVAGKAPDGKARKREAKLICAFTQSGLDAEGRPVRDEGSTSFAGAIEDSTACGHRAAQEALRRGAHQAGRVVVITDGAKYNMSIVKEHFPGATHILDLYHAREHLADFARGQGIPLEDDWHRKARRMLDKGRIGPLVKALEAALPAAGDLREEGLKQIPYFRDNAKLMRYDRFRKEGLFVGSGVMEAGGRTIVGQRLKCSGMFWTVAGANAIIALRTCLQSGRFEDFWAARSSERAA